MYITSYRKQLSQHSPGDLASDPPPDPVTDFALLDGVDVAQESSKPIEERSELY